MLIYKANKHLQRLLSPFKRRRYGDVSAGKTSRLVLGIETSCDDTGAAVLSEEGTILGESLHSQKEVHLRTGGIIPAVAQQLHREHIERVVQEALDHSGVDPGQLSAVATTVKPGLALSLGVGLKFSLDFVRRHHTPFIPIHHMEAHALTVRLLQPVSFPFLVLLVSGGHSLLAVARGVDDFLLLGRTLDEAPGDTLDKVARRLSLIKHPRCSTLSGGQAIELLAKDGDRSRFPFKTPMGQTYDCCFSFAGLRNQVTMTIEKMEAAEGIDRGALLSCVNDIAAATQHTVACHLAKRMHRAILFCKANGLLPSLAPTLIVSGGVASNEYIRRALGVITDATGLHLVCPPAKFCTDNGVMIAWNGVERLREGKGILPPDADVSYEPKAPLGVDLTSQVKAAAIPVPRIRMNI
ncbi:tRNA N6-adenosine threonylcarbamoyltransferase, mitochondrial [Corythoichthys intestinalis]|uniref:tRNA N6-adenosine threonylcarbamoyltransferase, mitochondrial n=1 Tax=Corythoichthys intestinalis TaxID=161448 RepID=UPI0025A63D43|nr:tRNA N6-adenosine threonylcarbamoyltransferase, mitochondrial [Corythoichthys intestinalis]XP_061799919.1 tRNA N6-adenosine threonylcarbamoyltransferase, mitochondrial-like [Nerophis lumbriciformis]